MPWGFGKSKTKASAAAAFSAAGKHHANPNDRAAPPPPGQPGGGRRKHPMDPMTNKKLAQMGMSPQSHSQRQGGGSYPSASPSSSIAYQPSPSSTHPYTSRSNQGDIANDDETPSDIPEEWKQKSAKQRRFTITSRPDLHEKAEEALYDEDYEGNVTSEQLENKTYELSYKVDDMYSHIEELKDRHDEGELDADSDEEEELRRNNDDRYNDDEILITKGFLVKQGGGKVRRSWKRRYFILSVQTRPQIYYLSDPRSRQPKGSMMITPSSFVRPMNSRKTKHGGDAKGLTNDNGMELYAADPQGNQRCYLLLAESKTSFLAWYQTFEYLIAQTKRMYNTSSGFASGSGLSNNNNAGNSEEEQRIREQAALCCSAHGPGLYDAVVGEKMEFSIISNDEFGNADGASGLKFDIALESVGFTKENDVQNQDLHYDLSAEDNFDGTYSVSYVLTRPGEYMLNVWLDGCEIEGSPFHLEAKLGKTSSRECIASGQGLATADPNAVNVITITARDKFGYNKTSGGDALQVGINGPAVLVGPVIDNENGTYTINYRVDSSKNQGKNQSDQIQISVLLDDGLNYPSWPMHIGPADNRSPFTPSIGIPRGGGYNHSVSPEISRNFSPSQVNKAHAMLSAQVQPQAAVKGQLSQREAALAAQEAKLRAMQEELSRERSAMEQQLSSMSGLGRRIDADSHALLQATEMQQGMRRGAPPIPRGARGPMTPPSGVPLPGAAMSMKHFSPSPPAKQQEQNSNVFSHEVQHLFDKYDASLRQVFAYYSDRSTGSVDHSRAVALPAFIELGASYDIFPTFLSRSELREVFTGVNRGQNLDFPAFLKTLLGTAMAALSKPMFAHLYPSEHEKLSVLLEMWGVADPLKLDEIQRKKR